jgi:hypothetical protein
MTLVKVGTPVATTTATSPDVAALLAQLQAAQAALAAEKARADAAEKSKGASRGYSAKVSEKGAISISGINTRFPVTLYAPHFVGVALDFILTDKAVGFLRENADRLSVKVNGDAVSGTDASRDEVLRLADRLAEVVARLK